MNASGLNSTMLSTSLLSTNAEAFQCMCICPQATSRLTTCFPICTYMICYFLKLLHQHTCAWLAIGHLKIILQLTLACSSLSASIFKVIWFCRSSNTYVCMCICKYSTLQLPPRANMHTCRRKGQNRACTTRRVPRLYSRACDILQSLASPQPVSPSPTLPLSSAIAWQPPL